MKNKSNDDGCSIVILAAGLGKRMHSPLPKVLNEIGNMPLIEHLLRQIYETYPFGSVAVVVGHQREKVENFVREHSLFNKKNIQFIVQPQQLGTGHAMRCVVDSEWGKLQMKRGTPLLVLPGDQPLVSPALIWQISQPLQKGAVIRLLTCEAPDPTGYGRILRKSRKVLGIVEEKDASPLQKKITEIGVSIYLFAAEFLRTGLPSLSPANAQGEYYLTDLVGYAAKKKKTIETLFWKDSNDVLGINNLWELAVAARILNERVIRNWALKGVRFIDPWSVQLDALVELSEGVVIHPGAILSGVTKISKDVMIGPGVILKDTQIGERSQIKAGTICESSWVDADVNLGPYAHLRPDSHVEANVKIGNFVELKKARIGEHSSVAHLSYLGDATVGKRVNIGCGFVTCNFDGRVIDGERKHRTWIGDDVFMGSDCQVVAPINIGEGAYIASGSTITEDVEAQSLAIARSRQTTKQGYARKLKAKS